MGNNEFAISNKTTVLWEEMDMVDDKINKLIEKFIDSKEGKRLTEDQVAKLSGYTALRIHNLFSGKVCHPSFDLILKVADVLEIPFNEVSEILGLNAPNDTEVRCECHIGVYWDYDFSELMTREDFEGLVKKKQYTREQYCDREFNTNLEKFNFCPKCGKKIDWDAIRENR